MAHQVELNWLNHFEDLQFKPIAKVFWGKHGSQSEWLMVKMLTRHDDGTWISSGFLSFFVAIMCKNISISESVVQAENGPNSVRWVKEFFAGVGKNCGFCRGMQGPVIFIDHGDNISNNLFLLLLLIFSPHSPLLVFMKEKVHTFHQKWDEMREMLQRKRVWNTRTYRRMANK